jgi:hypothetical protein
MNATYAAAFEAQVAELTRIVDVPASSPLGYGVDLACVEDLTPTMDEVDPYTPRAIGEAQARRLITGRRQLADDPNYGTDVRGMLNQGYTETQLKTLDTEVHNELIKDDRIVDCEVTTTFTNQETLRVAVISTRRDLDETFALTFYVTDASVLIEQLG